MGEEYDQLQRKINFYWTDIAESAINTKSLKRVRECYYALKNLYKKNNIDIEF